MFTERDVYVRREMNKEFRLRAEAHRRQKLLQSDSPPFRPLGLFFTKLGTKLGNLVVRFGCFLGADACLPRVNVENPELA
ncbi:MAG: hypothetical protein GXP38_01685 [Chloroflexi bacterium]|nr:hypothetical protein [Chloroflexota bacterium]